MEAWLLRTGSDRGGALVIALHVCQRNVVILDSPCQAISLIMALIWNVGLWFVFLPILLHQPSPPPSTQSSTSITIARGNLSILLAHPPSCVFEFSLTLGSICMSLPQGPKLGPSAGCSFLFRKSPIKKIYSGVFFCNDSLRLWSHWGVALIVISDAVECLTVQMLLLLLTVRHPDPQHQESLDSQEETDNKTKAQRVSAHHWWI